MRRGICILLGLGLLSLGTAWALDVRATREQVIAELGKPTSSLVRGDREILLYPKGVRVELEAGRIVSVKGIVLSEAAPPRVEPPPPPATAEKAKPAAAPVEPKKPGGVNQAAMERENAEATAKAQARMEKSVEALIDQSDRARAAPPRRVFDPVRFGVTVVLKLLMTVAALKLACKYWGCEIFWSGILIVAVADAVTRGGMTLAGELLLGLPTLFYLDEAIAGIVMILVLKKVSINQSTGQAVQLTVTTKTFTIVVGAFLVSFILRLLHGS